MGAGGALLAKPEDVLSLCCAINHRGSPLSLRNSPVLPNDKRLMSLLSATCRFAANLISGVQDYKALLDT